MDWTRGAGSSSRRPRLGGDRAGEGRPRLGGDREGEGRPNLGVDRELSMGHTAQEQGVDKRPGVG